MTTTDLKKYIYENDKIAFVLEKCKCHHIRDHMDYISAGNPDGDNIGAINIYKNEYLSYVNYTRGIEASDKQDIINLVQSVNDYDFITALKWLHQILDLQYSYQRIVKKVDKRNIVLDTFRKYRKYYHVCNVNDIRYDVETDFEETVPTIYIDIFREGVTRKAVKKFGLMYDYRHKRTLFPIRRWYDGKILGVNGRTSVKEYEIIGIPKYKLTKNYIKSNNIYGLYENRNDIERSGYVVVVESEKTVLKRYSRNDPTVVAIQGKVLSAEQQRILLGLNVNEIVFALDKDVNAWDVMSLCERFYHIRKVSMIIDTEDLLEKKDSPGDADNLTYNRLFKKRVTYDDKMHKIYERHNKR